jgi:hypothetical protein
LLDEQVDQKAAVYTVRLGFRAREGDRPGRRVYDIRLQGRTVYEGFDIAQAAGIGRAVIREFPDIVVADKLLLELAPKTESPGEAEAPLINFVEIVRSHR